MILVYGLINRHYQLVELSYMRYAAPWTMQTVHIEGIKYDSETQMPLTELRDVKILEALNGVGELGRKEGLKECWGFAPGLVMSLEDYPKEGMYKPGQAVTEVGLLTIHELYSEKILCR